jgi:hypothetical protein
VGLLGGHVVRQEAEAFENALDVGVDGKDVFVKRKEQNAPRGFSADAVKLEQILFGGFD